MEVCTASLILRYGFMADFGIFNYHKYSCLPSPWMCWVLDRIVVVGADDDSFEDDVVIALNGQRLMSLSSFHKIDFEGVWDHTDGGKTDGRHNNINLTYGGCKSQHIGI
jgi:hypothetical protein